MIKGPTEYEYQILANQVTIMTALTTLLSHAAYQSPNYEPLIKNIANMMENSAKETANLLGALKDET